MFSPCLGEEGFEPCLAPSGRDAYQILIDALDALVAAGVVPAEARPGAELPAWAMVHGLSALVVDGALQLAGRERTAVIAATVRTTLAGIGADPSFLPPRQVLPALDPRQAAGPGRAAG
jgi:hypothetical protein